MVLSDTFRRSPQLGAFLRFVVEAVLHGKSDRIKAYTIGVEVLRRNTNFDPQLDPIVRVEATRLRRAIERYYAGPGAEDRIIIDLPRGAYVPIFRRREMEARSSATLAAAIARPFQRLGGSVVVASIAMLGIVGVVVLVGVIVQLRSQPPASGDAVPMPDTSIVATGGLLGPGNGMPTIYIEPLRVVGSASPQSLAADILLEKINDAFARFDTINVVLAPRPAADAPAVEPRSDYRLSGGVEYIDNLAHAWFRLVDTVESNVVWSRLFERIPASNEPGVVEQSIVVALTNSLLQSYGVIRARDRAKHLASGVGDARSRCILEAAAAIRTAERRRHDRARDCLERLTTLDPSFAVGFTFLALIYNREFQLDYELRAGDPPPLERALQAVRRSIALHPESSRGYLALMVIQFNRRDIAAALAAGDKCLSLNKYDMLALGEYGGRLILTGDVDRGMAMLAGAGTNVPVRPLWHHIYLFIGNYIRGDLKEAARHAGEIPDENVALGQVARVLAAHSAGDRERTRQTIERLVAVHPEWRDHPRDQLARLIADRSIVDHLARDLAAAGLPGRS